jgi:serine/threonine-protein kinase
MVAAAGSTEASSPAFVWACIAIVVVGILLEFALAGRARLYETVGVPSSPELLTARAQELLRKFGYVDPPAVTANGFDLDANLINWIDTHDNSATRWKAPDQIEFWYRQSYREFDQRQILGPETQGRVSSTDPPMEDAGMILVYLSPYGKLQHLQVVTQRKPAAPAGTHEMDWNPLLLAAGLDPAKCASSAPHRTPPAYADSVAAWTTPMPDRPGVTLQLDAAAYAGRPIYFNKDGPWSPAPGVASAGSPDRIEIAFALVIVGSLLVFGSALAWRNLRRHRADMQGSWRLAAFVFSVVMITWVFGSTHQAQSWEAYNLTLALAWASLSALFLWMMYIALEPFVRRRMPELLISWSRLLAGNFRDPMVGRDLLAGAAVALLSRMLGRIDIPYAMLRRLPPPAPSSPIPILVTTAPSAVAHVLSLVSNSVFNGLAFLFIFVIFQRIVRNKWAAAAVFVAFWLLKGILQGGTAPPAVIGNLLSLMLLVALLMRFGILAVVVEVFFESIQLAPFTMQGSVWYAWMGWFSVAIMMAILVFAARSALAGTPLLVKMVFAED